jgi:C1A family cysteine protease
MPVYNHKKDSIDISDHKFHLQIPQKTVLSTSVDLRKSGFMPPVLNQLNCGSCTANATSNTLRFLLKKENLADWQPSRLFIYYYSRLLENTVNEDSGAMLRDVMKAVSTYGVCPENNWIYDISKFNVKPSLENEKEALFNIKNFQYLSVQQDLKTIKNTLALNLPILFGITVFDSFESEDVAQTGLVPMPDLENENCLGGHAIMMVGYDDTTQLFTICNSWGDSWGDKGFCYFPYQYILDSNLASDFWCIRFFI